MSTTVIPSRRVEETDHPMLTTSLDHLVRARMLYGSLALVLTGILVAGAYAYGVQLTRGLGVTGLNDQLFWGIYVANFVFFIGISYAGTLMSSVLRLAGQEWRRPVTRIAEMITVFALLAGAVMVIIDMGRPERALSVLVAGRPGSPLLWDFIAINTYLMGALLYLYLPLIPDAALLRDDAPQGGWRHRIYSLVALGWRDTERQRHLLERAITVISVALIPIAISAHSVVAWIFGTTWRTGWHSTIMAPYFVLGAIFSGTAAIIIMMAFFRYFFGLEDVLTRGHFRKVGNILLFLNLGYIYFVVSEYVTLSYGGGAAYQSLLGELFVGQYAVMMWAALIGGLVIPAAILLIPALRTLSGIVVASILVVVGMWLKRFLIVVPSLAKPIYGDQWALYQPTWVEWLVTAAAGAGIVLAMMAFARWFPLISRWEMAEGEGSAHGLPESKDALAAKRLAERQRKRWDRNLTLGIFLIGVPLATLLLFGGGVPVQAAAATPTVLTLDIPEHLRADSTARVRATLTTVDGDPVGGAVIAFSRPTVVGTLPLGNGRTSPRGTLLIPYRERVGGAFNLQASFAGTEAYAPTQVTVPVIVEGGAVSAYESRRESLREVGSMTRWPALVVVLAAWSALGYVGIMLVRLRAET